MRLIRSTLILGAMASVLELGVLAHPCTARGPAAAGDESEGSLKGYLVRIKPLLRSRCYSCHGGLKQKAGLRVDTAELMRRGGDSGNGAAAQKTTAADDGHDSLHLLNDRTRPTIDPQPLGGSHDPVTNRS